MTDAEKEWALQQYEWADPESAVWLTDTISSAAGGEEAMANLDEDDFMNLGTKLGGEWWELEEMFDDADWDGSGDLDIWEQDSVWNGLMMDNTEKALWDIEEAAWDILDSVWEAQNDMWEECDDCWDCGCWDDTWDCPCTGDWDCGCWDGTWDCDCTGDWDCGCWDGTWDDEWQMW